MNHWFYIFIFLLGFNTWSQTKVEIEKRVKTEEVPSLAVESLEDNLQESTYIKWYYQEDDDKKVYEAKFKQESNQYSLEFDIDGEIHNVEVIIEINQIKRLVYKSILKNLEQNFEGFKIRKIQREYLGEADDLWEIISDDEVDSDLTIRYEIEVNAKVDKQRKLFEMLFDSKGNLLRQREIKLKSTDILDY